MPAPSATGNHSTQRSLSRDSVSPSPANARVHGGSAAIDFHAGNGATFTEPCLLEASRHNSPKHRPAPEGRVIMPENKKPVLRFAPSPTGFLHIGGAQKTGG